jgi:hypothetical protein
MLIEGLSSRKRACIYLSREDLITFRLSRCLQTILFAPTDPLSMIRSKSAAQLTLHGSLRTGFILGFEISRLANERLSLLATR